MCYRHSSDVLRMRCRTSASQMPRPSQTRPIYATLPQPSSPRPIRIASYPCKLPFIGLLVVADPPTLPCKEGNCCLSLINEAVTDSEPMVDHEPTVLHRVLELGTEQRCTCDGELGHTSAVQ